MIDTKDKPWVRKLFRQRVFIAVLLILQIVLLVRLVISRTRTSQIFGLLMTVISFLVVIHIASQPKQTSYKVTWIFLILVFPFFGGLLYLLLYFQTSTKRFRKRMNQDQNIRRLAYLPADALESAEAQTPEHLSQLRYLQNHVGYPVYTDTHTHYLSPGEAVFPVILEELEKAEHYIFLEYFIVQDGAMWNRILDILKRKAAGGVTVRLIYDDIGCFLQLPQNYPKTLRKYGIECVTFNPFKPLLTVTQNNRDHRKILVIDGKTAFTGGINLADEYINVYEKHGYWKDSCIMLQGKAAWSFTIMFLEMWRLCTGSSENIETFYPQQPWESISDGFVQPYADSPMDDEYVGVHVYLQMINSAKHYLYINTPYLVIDDTIMTALCLAAKSGVDVRIVTPHIGDKKIVHMTTRSYYPQLLDAGVRIYEYTPGFIHSKTMVCDDSTATIGTINLDYRSLYLHFECGVWLYESTAVFEVRNDFLQTLEQCQEIREKDCRTGFYGKVRNTFLRLISPLL